MTAEAKRKRNRYRHDAEYRAAEIRRAGDLHQRNMSSAAYRELTAKRKLRYATQEKIKLWQTKVKSLKTKLWHLNRRIEVLEIDWGMERAERKRRDQTNQSGGGPHIRPHLDTAGQAGGAG